uniref:Myb/SANT-like DNA-binding domain-containing protein n=1 Tax=Magallana gigas TaxID=29159 RepID=K1QY81_MAGGI
MDAKKQRKANFSDVEVKVLVDAVGTSYKILYGKFSPCLTNNMRTMAWESVTEKVDGYLSRCWCWIAVFDGHVVEAAATFDDPYTF